MINLIQLISDNSSINPIIEQMINGIAVKTKLHESLDAYNIYYLF